MITEFDKATELKPGDFDSIASCLVLAPHPDDESLGCGGLISLLRDRSIEVTVIFITDGSLSHPNSQLYPAAKLSALRQEEAIAALQVLGVSPGHSYFLNKKDGALPSQGEAGFEQNANQLHLLIALLQPELVLVPYEKDPHRDHRATWQMLMYSPKDISVSFRILEYLVWLLERGEEGDKPDVNSVRYVDITKYLAQKQQAIDKHVSQTTTLIHDDPNGFILSDTMLQHFFTGKEYYIDREL